jgi:hypothetical protein
MEAVDKLRAFKQKAMALPAEERQAQFASPEFRELVISAQGEAVIGVRHWCVSHCYGHCISHCYGHGPVRYEEVAAE